MRAALAVAIVAIGAPAAAAPRRPLPPVKPSPPDEGAVAMSEESNLEWPRAGFRAAVAVGPSMQVGMGIDESSGAGGGGSVRVGTASGPRLAWIFEVASTAYLAEDDSDVTRFNRSTLLAIGAQVHVTPAAWLRFGGGLAGYARGSERGSQVESRERELVGVGSVVGAGFDLVRRGDLALSAELTALVAFYGDGVVTGSFLGLGLAYY